MTETNGKISSKKPKEIKLNQEFNELKEEYHKLRRNWKQLERLPSIPKTTYLSQVRGEKGSKSITLKSVSSESNKCFIVWTKKIL